MNLIHRLFGAPVPTIRVPELQEKRQNGRPPVVLDVRQPLEYRSGHIAGAKLIPLGDLDKRLNELPRDREIVCICATGHRSIPAANKLISAGYRAINLENGMLAWRAARLPVVKGE
jgi:rhodanese-related sulfurtransferase